MDLAVNNVFALKHGIPFFLLVRAGQEQENGKIVTGHLLLLHPVPALLSKPGVV
jgi:hypothetical protein